MRVQPERMHHQGLSDDSLVEVAWPDAFQWPPGRRPVPREVTEDPTVPTLLAEMQTAAKLDGENFWRQSDARLAQHNALLREASRVVQDRLTLGGGGEASAAASREMRLMTLARAL